MQRTMDSETYPGSRILELAAEAVGNKADCSVPGTLLIRIFSEAGMPQRLRLLTQSGFTLPAQIFDLFTSRKTPALRQHFKHLFKVVAAPGHRLERAVRTGDMIFRRGLGEGNLAHVAIVVNPRLWSYEELRSAGLMPECHRAGKYVQVLDGGAYPHTIDDHFARRILGPDGRTPPEQVILRLKSREIENEQVAMDSEFAEGAESNFEQVFFSPEEQMDCDLVQVNCEEMTDAELQKVKQRGKPEGDMINRTEGDPDKNLSIQITDYDVNEWRAARKDRHRLGMEKVIDFIVGRARQIIESPDGIQITITGGASRTGSQQYNAILSCKRAVCVAKHLVTHLSAHPGGGTALMLKIKFDVNGKGFEEAKCIGNECEIGEFRSVLISVHRPGLPPPPLPIVPVGWDKYRIRCCSFKTESIGEAILGDLIDRGIDALPGPLKDFMKGSDTARSVLEKAIKELIKVFKEFLKKAPGALGKLLGELLKKFPFPVEFIRDTGVFQIVERDKPNAKDIILCYTGFGLRVTFPRDLPGLPGGFIPESLKESLKEFLKKQLKVKGLPIDILFDVLSGKIPTIESTTPGPFTEFDLDRKVKLKAFEGPGEALKGIEIGKIFVGFGSRRTFDHPDPAQRPKITCSTGCTPRLVPVIVGKGTGFEVVAPTKGELVDADCKCT